MSIPLRRIALTVGIALGLGLSSLAATAQTAVKVGGLRTSTWLTVVHAHKQGYFKDEGLDVELITVNSGPAVVSAVASKSVDIGYTASVPVLFARAQNQPVRIFGAFTYETGSDYAQWLLASRRSGVQSLKDLPGKTVAVVSMGSVCELMLRDHLAKAGIAFSAIKTIVVPFPQMQAALQLGTADVACTIEPFRTSMTVSPDVGAVQVAAGILQDASQRYALDILFAREDWGNANKETLRRFNRALKKSIREFQDDPARYRRTISEDFKLNPAVVSLMKNELNNRGELVPVPSEIRPLLDGLSRHGLIKTPLTPADVILSLE